MEQKHTDIFLTALESVLSQFGFGGVTLNKESTKDQLFIDRDFTVVIGITGDVKGNIAYSFSSDTARKLVSAMMMGAPVETMDDMAMSAAGELFNMVTANALTLFEKQGKAAAVSLPFVLSGGDIYAIISTVETTALEVDAGGNELELNIAIEE
ncbi:MAG TPA: chemotaxis protein CheX [Clostridiales bacterium]|nr:chemotaxis protein CheX [Clostridiales bacterium]